MSGEPLTREVFEPAIARLYRAQDETHRAIARESDGLRETFGWIAISLAFWLLMIGWVAVRGQLRGEPRG